MDELYTKKDWLIYKKGWIIYKMLCVYFVPTIWMYIEFIKVCILIKKSSNRFIWRFQITDQKTLLLFNFLNKNTKRFVRIFQIKAVRKYTWMIPHTIWSTI